MLARSSPSLGQSGVVKLGKPYITELERLAETYRWALAQPVGLFVPAFQAVCSLPLLTIGSGGSFTTAHFTATQHRDMSGKLSTPFTPLEVLATKTNIRANAVFLATAGGRNPDVLGAFRGVAVREPRRFVVLCTRPRTPLARLAADFHYVDFIELDLPSQKDGFLATNSLLASTVIVARLYAEAMNRRSSLPVEFESLFAVSTRGDLTTEFEKCCEPLWSRQTLIVLHGPQTASAAIDIESKFTEAALGTVQTADYRNFAHGRHHWIARHADQSAVVAFVTRTDEATGAKTLALIPKSVPVLRLDIPFEGAAANLSALVNVFHLVGSAGRARGIDPGRPGVPGFGRRLYHLRANEYGRNRNEDVPIHEAVAVERKSGKPIATLFEENSLIVWREAYTRFAQKLFEAQFRALVLDYDGTLCDEKHRRDGLTTEVSRALSRILRHDVLIGIATGRGKSIRESLRRSLPEKHWNKVIVGYYNGGDVALLSDESRPDGTPKTSDVLRPVEEALKAHELLGQLADFEFRLPQIKVESKEPRSIDSVWALLQHVVHGLGIPGISVLRSGHSMDVIAPGVTKRSVIPRLVAMLGKSNPAILCIGDRGQWPGNDFSVLNGSYSLSVDEVSEDQDSCWNLSLPGQRGPQATLELLRNLRPGRSGLRLISRTRNRRQS